MQIGVKEKLFCEIAVKLGFITKAQAMQALNAQRVDEEKGLKKKIGAYLLEMNLLDKDQLDKVLSHQIVGSLEDMWGTASTQNDFESEPGTSSEDDSPKPNDIPAQSWNTAIIIAIIFLLIVLGAGLYWML